MNISFKAYDSLPKEAVFIRTTVFVDEQGFREEFDTDDHNALHILMFDGDKAIGTCRVIYSKKHESITVGRVAVLKEYRGKNLGKAMMLFCEKEIVKRYGEIQIGVGAQDRAVPFYLSIGYIRTKEEYLDENYPHVWMVKKLTC